MLSGYLLRLLCTWYLILGTCFSCLVSIFKNSKKGFDFIKGDAGKGAELLDGDELVWLFFVHLPDFGQQVLSIPLTLAGDKLNIFGVYDTSLSVHGAFG